MDPDKKLDQSQNPLVKQKKVTDFSGQPAAKRPRRPSCSSITGEIVCMCSSGCNTQRCSCFKMNGKCGSECKCMACRNPLNILADNGINIDHAKEDQCLMQNIAKMKDLGKFIKENIERTPCCDAEISMKDACVGVVLCPECSAEYRFSWCTFSLHDDEDRPRNHCSICKKCGDYRDDHCQKCNKCYFAGRSGTLKCPCQDRPSFIDSLGAFIGALRDPVSDYSDDDYY
ncbi:E3 ubiquitin-protein ligase MIEL1 [Exaiptasia diaphana]|uniref:Tesmin/TSO1-like CXC domain-containing protein n=1 Tax=Exaiptasia diaphana TaxID=2652724 RepID=A0A913XRQ2_EXADI|nr:E3 ubiquitin-protein ligase MIEL1 [Exaiptasia diaphana]